MLDHRTETFMTVCNVMNYREAAELLHITQPAVTQHIQFLEKEYGCRFFLYENRKLIKTPAAQMLEEHLRSAQQRENFLREKLKNPPPYKPKKKKSGGLMSQLMGAGGQMPQQ